MKKYTMPKRADKAWIVMSGARLLPASLQESLVWGPPAPRRAPSLRQRRRFTPMRIYLAPLSRRPAFRDH